MRTVNAHCGGFYTQLAKNWTFFAGNTPANAGNTRAVIEAFTFPAKPDELPGIP
jgi:hypothetical protein